MYTKPSLCHLAPIAVLLVPIFAAGCAAQEKKPAERVDYLVTHGQFAEAVEAADRYRRENPGDARAVELHKSASVAYLLEQGRRLTFEDQDTEALAIFEGAYRIDPQSRETGSWLDKTKRKLADTWVARGLEFHAKEELAAAVEAYEQALRYVPGDPNALNGLATAVFHINFREGLSEKYFKEGLAALSRYWLEQARSRFSYSAKYEPEDERTAQRQDQVESLLSAQRATVAAKLEGLGRFDAARNEFRLALALDPTNEEARIGKERVEKEAKAAARMRESDIAILRGKFEDSDKLLAEGEALTSTQKDALRQARERLEQARFQKVYDEGLALERDMQFEEAIAKYAELLEMTPYFKDALTRKETLEGYVRLAGELYAKAATATTSEERKLFLQQISLFWPEYEDVERQLRDLE